MAGSTEPFTAGNGSLMRLAPVPLFFATDPRRAMDMAAESSRTTHGAQTCLDACRYFAGLIVGALQGVSRDELLSAFYSPASGYSQEHPPCEEIAEIAAGSFKTREPPEIKGSGYVVRSLEAAPWAFHHSTDFRDGALKAVNLGAAADTTGAIYGQLAGAFYCAAGIPTEWTLRISCRELIQGYAADLHAIMAGPL